MEAVQLGFGGKNLRQAGYTSGLNQLKCGVEAFQLLGRVTLSRRDLDTEGAFTSNSPGQKLHWWRGTEKPHCDDACAYPNCVPLPRGKPCKKSAPPIGLLPARWTCVSRTA